jgi:hypothetical protein
VGKLDEIPPPDLYTSCGSRDKRALPCGSAEVAPPKAAANGTLSKSRLAFGSEDEDAEEIATPTRSFSLLEVTSGLPDDSREEDERAAEQRLRDLRGRVNCVILEDLEQKVLALRALHTKLRDLDAGESFGDVVARSRPKAEML